MTEEKVYVGYYDNIKIALSNQKKLVKNYMEFHRGLIKSEYRIEKEYVRDIDLISTYDKIIISEFNGFFIPEIDQLIIEMNSNEIYQEISMCEDLLKHITSLASDLKKVSDKDISILIQSIRIIDRFKKSGKIIDKLETRNLESHTILFCPIDMYLKEVHLKLEMIEMDKQYRYILDKE